MNTEKAKSLRGELYNASDPELTNDRKRARLINRKFNDSGEEEPERRTTLLQELMPKQGSNLHIEPPFYCDYGYNIITGDSVYFNFGCTILDVALVEIGDRVLIGPQVQIYTATHPLEWKTRAAGLESAKPIRIGSDVWIGGGTILCPGVVIGERSVIGAGSVVTKDIPPDVVAAGNPCRVIRNIQA